MLRRRYAAKSVFHSRFIRGLLPSWLVFDTGIRKRFARASIKSLGRGRRWRLHDGIVFEPTVAFFVRSATIDSDFPFTWAVFGAEGSVTHRYGVRPEIEASESVEPVRRRGMQCAPGRRARTSSRGRG